MLIEVKVRVKRTIGGKTKSKLETFLKDTCSLFVEAEQAVMEKLTTEQTQGLVEDFEILSIRQSPIKEICLQYNGGNAYIASLTDVFHDSKGNEKTLRYKVLLWADNLSQANQRVADLAAQGYDMHIEGIKEVNWEYLATTTKTTTDGQK